MKPSSQLRRVVSTYRHLDILCMFLILIPTFSALARPAHAEVVYTPVGVTKTGNAAFKFDLNQDGVRDFVLSSAAKFVDCGNRGCFTGSTKIKPLSTGNGVVVSHLNYAAVLGSGVPIDGSDTFYVSKVAVVTRFFLSGGEHTLVAGYLGLEFQINGETHYGWAQIQVDAGFGYMDTTLVGFAYETVPGKSINTGQTSDAYTTHPTGDLLGNWAGLDKSGNRTGDLETPAWLFGSE